MPAEWEPHSATWLSWPHNPATWPGQDMSKIEAVYIQMINALSKGEKVHLLVNHESAALKLNKFIKNNPVNFQNITIHFIPTNDAWMRDYGPNFLVRETTSGNREVAANLWKFNSWGEKYSWDMDIRVSRTITNLLEIEAFEPGIILEGGAIEVNGQGICITTEQCLLNPNRNNALGKTDMESYLRHYLGVEDVIWCQGNIEGDDTDGHIDNLVRFVNPNTVLCSWVDDSSDPNHACLKENLKILESYRDTNGKPLNIVRLPMPGRIEGDKERLPASYANFYIGNRAILLPTYNHSNDDVARYILKRFFADREIVGIPCETFIWGLGAIHCVTQQQPRAGN
ncbi:MAG: agmatine deiminase family protein [Nitrospinota bacterium]|nr:agmatine deiminase family protein [Nitrospinota bacterium]